MEEKRKESIKKEIKISKRENRIITEKPTLIQKTLYQTETMVCFRHKKMSLEKKKVKNVSGKFHDKRMKIK